MKKLHLLQNISFPGAVMLNLFNMKVLYNRVCVCVCSVPLEAMYLRSSSSFLSALLPFSFSHRISAPIFFFQSGKLNSIGVIFMDIFCEV